ncbi:GyrI-like domain-containing protein [Nonlabens sp. Hel1_33_55]|uniref:AraC family transcriptional regulator n=1 Tax=Nonlabens sp. Hel1_33_55 TaxID=1336802 RepID=UPI000B892834|nr:GyrI-like domain-containing protein [Nonlabens sp. Hel1_33_55]
MNSNINIVQVESMKLIAVPVVGFQNLSEAYSRLISWAIPKGLMDHPNTQMVQIYHDSARDTAHDNVRISACLKVSYDVEVDSKMKLLELDPGRCIVASMQTKPAEFENSWKNLFKWMNDNNHFKADSDPFEIHHNNYREHPEGKCIVDLCIPIN